MEIAIALTIALVAQLVQLKFTQQAEKERRLCQSCHRRLDESEAPWTAPH